MSVDSRETPYYLIDLSKLEENYESFKNCIKDYKREDIIAYSVKANYNIAILKKLNDLQAYFEVCSDYEFNLVRKYGIDSKRIIINGCFFSDLSKYDNSLLILDTTVQLTEWIKKGCKQKIGIRINIDYATTDKRFKNKQSRFGVQFYNKKIDDLLCQANISNIVCIHCHLSGNNREPSIYRDIILQLENIRKTYELNHVEYFNIGGGYKIGKDNNLWSFNDYLKEINEVCPPDIKIIFEPGNSLVRECAEYHTKIISIKRKGEEFYFVADGSSLHIPKADYKKVGFCFKKLSNKKSYSGNKIYGNTCKESDLLLSLSNREELSVGDYLILSNIGAYSLNEVNSMILGKPKVYIDNNEDTLLGHQIFTRICSYSDIYRSDKRNDYSVINKKADQKGLYAFVDNNDNVLYIGVAYNRNICDRVVQHFRKDSGGLRKKLTKKDLKILEESNLYISKIDEIKQNLLYEEAFLIGLYRPRFNYL
jgi:diaminopimelate decarboxylase